MNTVLQKFFLPLIPILLLNFFVFVAPPAEAQTLGDFVHGSATQFIQFTNGFGVNDYSDITQPGVIIQRIIAVVFGFLGLIAVIMIIYAGFLWLTAGGEEDRAEKGRTLLFQAVIGLIIILASWSVAYFVMRMLTFAIVK